MGIVGVKSTMTPRRPDTAPSYGKHAPGPGAYDPGSTKQTAPAYRLEIGLKYLITLHFRMGTESRGRKNKNQGPAPGSYNPLELTRSNRPSSPSWGYLIYN
jgi:hypothetical protein